jgi:hypothetical protein
LTNDSYYASYAIPEVIERNRKLVAVWDALSLIVCHGVPGEEQVTPVPTTDGDTALKLTLLEDEDNHHQVTISPWPFQQSEVKLFYEGRLLRETFSDETAMREALMSADWVSLSTTLKAPSSP